MSLCSKVTNTLAITHKPTKGKPKPTFIDYDENFVRIETDGTITYNPGFNDCLIYLNIRKPFVVAQCRFRNGSNDLDGFTLVDVTTNYSTVGKKRISAIQKYRNALAKKKRTPEQKDVIR